MELNYQKTKILKNSQAYNNNEIYWAFLLQGNSLCYISLYKHNCKMFSLNQNICLKILKHNLLFSLGNDSSNYFLILLNIQWDNNLTK